MRCSFLEHRLLACFSKFASAYLHVAPLPSSQLPPPPPSVIHPHEKQNSDRDSSQKRRCLQAFPPPPPPPGARAASAHRSCSGAELRSSVEVPRSGWGENGWGQSAARSTPRTYTAQQRVQADRAPREQVGRAPTPASRLPVAWCDGERVMANLVAVFEAEAGVQVGAGGRGQARLQRQQPRAPPEGQVLGQGAVESEERGGDQGSSRRPHRDGDCAGAQGREVFPGVAVLKLLFWAPFHRSKRQLRQRRRVATRATKATRTRVRVRSPLAREASGPPRAQSRRQQVRLAERRSVVIRPSQAQHRREPTCASTGSCHRKRVSGGGVSAFFLKPSASPQLACLLHESTPTHDSNVREATQLGERNGTDRR